MLEQANAFGGALSSKSVRSIVEGVVSPERHDGTNLATNEVNQIGVPHKEPLEVNVDSLKLVASRCSSRAGCATPRSSLGSTRNPSLAVGTPRGSIMGSVASRTSSHTSHNRFGSVCFTVKSALHMRHSTLKQAVPLPAPYTPLNDTMNNACGPSRTAMSFMEFLNALVAVALYKEPHPFRPFLERFSNFIIKFLAELLGHSDKLPEATLAKMLSDHLQRIQKKQSAKQRSSSKTRHTAKKRKDSKTPKRDKQAADSQKGRESP